MPPRMYNRTQQKSTTPRPRFSCDLAVAHPPVKGAVANTHPGLGVLPPQHHHEHKNTDPNKRAPCSGTAAVACGNKAGSRGIASGGRGADEPAHRMGLASAGHHKSSEKSSDNPTWYHLSKDWKSNSSGWTSSCDQWHNGIRKRVRRLAALVEFAWCIQRRRP